MSVEPCFKKRLLDIFVAPDEEARVLDMTGVTHIYNYDIPPDAVQEFHLGGGSGRLGKGEMSETCESTNVTSQFQFIVDIA
ncbi:hypothetical protein OO5_00591 [Enterococcus faecalis V583]|uniref:hypothetical protein n=1 Tax=Enterococcus faecalis TaxID=1351 RepID=UPI00033E3F74|nr:hypothetical protein [Enterococcus faecalis]EOT52001.1 hypothetical protein OO5_00591 [Enterococcus faecalis V583]